MKRKILLVSGHPDKESFNVALYEAYKKGALESGAELSELIIRDLNFNPNLEFGYRKEMELEPDLVEALEKIKAADHIVWVFPMWWYSIPAIMKGFIDRAFLPGIAFKFEEGKPLPKKLLKGRSARIIVTADTPNFFDRLFMRRPMLNQFKRGTLEFCGIKPVGVTYIAPLRDSKEEWRKKWLAKVEQLGRDQK